eukprot:gene12082-13326_t
MSKIMLYYLTVFLCLQLFGNREIFVRGSSKETALLTALLSNYSTTTRPVGRPFDAVQVAMDFKLIKIVKLDIKEQQLVVNSRVMFKWQDSALSWSLNDYNFSYINIPMSRIWTPDILLYNTAEGISQSSSDLYKAHVRLSYAGDIVWMSPVTFRSSCEIDVKWFPFDSQTCQLTFGSISLTKNKLMLRFFKQPTSAAGIKGKFHYSSGIWNLKSVTSSISEETYECCKEAFSLINFKINLDRLPLYWVLYLVLPCLCLSMVSLCSFYVPSESGERIGYSITVVLAMSVYLLVISEKLPEKSDSKPLIGILYIVLFIIMILILITVVFTTHMSYKVTKPPRGLRHLFCTRCYEKQKKRQEVDVVAMRIQQGQPGISETDVSNGVELRDSVASKRHVEISDFPRETVRRRISLNRTFSSLSVHDEQEMKYQEQWRSIAERVDKIFFWIFFALTVLSPAIVVGAFAA